MGGGGGGGRSLTPDQLKALESRAKEKLASSGSVGKCNVFISFASEDLNEVNLLRGQAKNENSDIEFNDWSLKEPFDSNRAEYIQRGLRERFRQCSVVVVYLSEHTASSKWVDWEIRECIKMGKRVVAMHRGATPPKQIPRAVTDHNVPVVSWNQKELTKAIGEQGRLR